MTCRVTGGISHHQHRVASRMDVRQDDSSHRLDARMTRRLCEFYLRAGRIWTCAEGATTRAIGRVFDKYGQTGAPTVRGNQLIKAVRIFAASGIVPGPRDVST